MEKKDPFIVGLEWELSKHGLSKKQAAARCGLKYPTFAKVMRTNGRGRDLTKNAIAAGFGYGSWADLYKLGQEREQTYPQNDKAADEELLKEMGDGDLRILIGRLIEKVDRIERHLFGDERPFRRRAAEKE